MIYEEHPSPAGAIAFSTHPKARRGRGVLFATAPWVVFMLFVSVMFVLAVSDLTIWPQVKRAAAFGALATTLLSAGCFLLGRRVRERIEVDGAGLKIHRLPALGAERTEAISFEGLAGFAIDPSLRSLGADVLLVAVKKDGARLAIAEGEPHSGQVRELAARIALLAGLPLETPRYGGPGG